MAINYLDEDINNEFKVNKNFWNPHKTFYTSIFLRFAGCETRISVGNRTIQFMLQISIIRFWRISPIKVTIETIPICIQNVKSIKFNFELSWSLNVSMG